jgi:hypothetical protein
MHCRAYGYAGGQPRLQPGELFVFRVTGPTAPEVGS